MLERVVDEHDVTKCLEVTGELLMVVVASQQQVTASIGCLRWMNEDKRVFAGEDGGVRKDLR